MDIGVVALFSSSQLKGTVGNDLVHVHIERCPCPTAQGVNHDVFEAFPGEHFVDSTYDCMGFFFFEKTKLCIRKRRRLLNQQVGLHKEWVMPLPDLAEIFKRPSGMHAVEAIVRYVKASK
jgi:hypothetical protein